LERRNNRLGINLCCCVAEVVEEVELVGGCESKSLTVEQTMD